MEADERLDDFEQAIVDTGGWVWTARRVDELLASGGPLEKRDNFGFTPLHWSLDKEDRARFTRLLEAGADPDAGALTFDDPPLLWACSTRDTFWAQRLLERGASVDRSNTKRQTPLMTACRKGFAEVVALLLRHGADATITTREGHTIVDAAIDSFDRATILTALETGVALKLDLAERLREAAYYKRVEQVQALAELRDILPFDPAAWASVAAEARKPLDDWESDPDDEERGEHVIELVRRFQTGQ